MPKLTHVEVDSKSALLLMLVALITLAGGLLITKASIGLAFTVLAAIVVGIVSFINTEIALYILIVSMLLGPQFVVGGPTPIPGRGRPLTLRVDDILLVVIGLSWFLRTAVQKELGLFLKTPLNRPIAYYFAVCMISTLFGYMMGRVKGITGFFFVLKYFEYFIVYFIAVNHLKERKQIERLLFTMLGVCFVVCLVAIYQVPAGGRATAPFEGEVGEPNTLGGYLVLMLPIAIGLLLTYGTKRLKIFLAVLAFLIFVTLAATLSRASWAALVPMTLALLYFSKKKLIIAGALALIIVLSPFILPNSVIKRVTFTFEQPKEAGQITVGNVRIDTSTSGRLESWKSVLEKDFVEQPILGYGTTGYRFLDAQYPRVLAENGLLGFITFSVLLFSIYMNALHTYRHSKEPLFIGLSLGYLAGFAAMLAHALGANTFIIVRIMEPFWFLTAMVIMIPTIEGHQHKAGD